MMTFAPSTRRASLVRFTGSRVSTEEVTVGGGFAHRRSTEPLIEVRPESVAAVRRSGSDPHQVLLFGAGVLTGLGLRDHNLGLPGHLADALVDATGRGVDVDVFVDRDPSSPAAICGLRGLRLQRYDAVVVILGSLKGARSRTAGWDAEVATLVGALETAGAEAAALLIVDSSTAMNHIAKEATPRIWSAVREQRVSTVEAICAQTGRVRFEELAAPLTTPAASGRFGDGTYRAWADRLVARLRPALDDADGRMHFESAKAFRARPHDEPYRRRALACLRIDRTARDEFLDFMVQQARRMFHTDSAAVHVLDGDELWSKATTGDAPYAIPQQTAFCDVTIQSDGLTLFNDLTREPRFRESPLVVGEAGNRFYAGYPIRTWDGYRVGVLCISDSTPRTMRRSELSGLRDLAGRIEQHLWMAALKG